MGGFFFNVTNMKKALITGITGQDGSYLAELLLKKGYEVHGIIRRSSSFNTGRIDHIYQDPHVNNARLVLHYGDLADAVQMVKLLYELQPDEIYNLGAQSHVKVSFDIPEYTGDVDGLGALRILEAIRETGLSKKTRFYQASSSEMFGKVQDVPQTEKTPFWPRSPYGCAKVFAYWLTVNYRESYGLHASNGILFNHESPRRGETFVTRKITRGLARIRLGLQSALFLGNMNAKRDWGHARDFVEAQWLILQQDRPDDYVIATGQQQSVRDFVALAARELGIEIAFEGTGVDEVGRVVKNADAGRGPKPGDVIVRVDPRYFRPTEVESLLGDASKARRQLGWTPRTSFQELVREMVANDLQIAERDALVAQQGYRTYRHHE